MSDWDVHWEWAQWRPKLETARNQSRKERLATLRDFAENFLSQIRAGKPSDLYIVYLPCRFYRFARGNDPPFFI